MDINNNVNKYFLYFANFNFLAKKYIPQKQCLWLAKLKD